MGFAGVSETAVSPSDLQAGVAFLAEAGLNLFAVLDCAALPASLQAALLANGVPLHDYPRLALLGHGGRQLWAALQKWGMETVDPVDHYTHSITQQFIRDYLHGADAYWLYPQTDHLVPLQQLGTLAGWSQPSPLGLGIHPTYGVWFAYRAAFLTTAVLPVRVDGERPSPCASCPDQPCIRTCPVGAAQRDRFDVEGCARHRLTLRSSCADRCLARLACPIAPAHRYTLPQVQYHYGHSLGTLRNWYAP